MTRLSANKPILLAGIALLIIFQAMPALAKCDCETDCDHGCCPASSEQVAQEARDCCAENSVEPLSDSDAGCQPDIDKSFSPLSVRSTECSCLGFLDSGPQAAVTVPGALDTNAGKRQALVLAIPVFGGPADLLLNADWFGADDKRVLLASPVAIYLVNSSFLA